MNRVVVSAALVYNAAPATRRRFMQDSSCSLPPVEAAAALGNAAARYKDALERLPGHVEAAYNLATCLSEQADLNATDDGDAAKQEQVRIRRLMMRSDSITVIVGVCECVFFGALWRSSHGFCGFCL